MPEYDLAAVPAHPDHGPTVVGDLPCTGCGYNLHGIPIARVCPECGRAVELSLQGELLRFSAPHYLKAIDFGLCVILTTIFIYVFVWALAVPLSLVLPDKLGSDLAKALFVGSMVLCDAAFVLGYWKFTTPDPGHTGREPPGSARRATRAAACIHAVFQLFVLSNWFIHLYAFLSLEWWCVAAIDYSIWAVLVYAAISHTRDLARRVPAQALISQTGTYMWVLPVITVLGFPMLCLGPLAALILYATMLQSLRTRTKEIIDWQQRAGRAVLGS